MDIIGYFFFKGFNYRIKMLELIERIKGYMIVVLYDNWKISICICWRISMGFIVKFFIC